MRREYHPYAIMLAVNAAISLSALFVPLLAKDIGLSLADIGIIGSAYGLASFFSYTIFGKLADLTGKEKEIVCAGLCVGTIFFGMQIYMKDFLSMIVLRAMAGISVGMCTFPLFSYIFGTKDYRQKIGWLAGFGSLGWAMGYLIAGVVGRWREGFMIAGLFFAFGFLTSLGLKSQERTRRLNSSVKEILARNLPLYLSYFLRHAGAYAVWAIFPVFLKEELGTPIFWIGMLDAINTGSQFFIMGTLGRKAGSWNGRKIFRIGLILSTSAFLLYSVVTSYLQLIPVMLMIAGAWSFLYIGALTHLLEKNAGKATSTGLLGSTISLSMVVGPVLGGFVSHVAGMRMTGVLAGILSLGGFVCSRFIK
ncbi:MAG: MFS transporter [Candidatus Hadarchaeales archaeon]